MVKKICAKFPKCTLAVSYIEPKDGVSFIVRCDFKDSPVKAKGVFEIWKSVTGGVGGGNDSFCQGKSSCIYFTARSAIEKIKDAYKDIK